MNIVENFLHFSPAKTGKQFLSRSLSARSPPDCVEFSLLCVVRTRVYEHRTKRRTQNTVEWERLIETQIVLQFWLDQNEENFRRFFTTGRVFGFSTGIPKINRSYVNNEIDISYREKNEIFIVDSVMILAVEFFEFFAEIQKIKKSVHTKWFIWFSFGTAIRVKCKNNSKWATL